MMFESESIDDVIKRLATDEGQQAVMDQERSFRRGFHHGYEAAINDFEAMLREQVATRLILLRMVTHSEGDVMDWRRRIDQGHESPPRLGRTGKAAI